MLRKPITYNGANRPVRFRNEASDTTIDCGYDITKNVCELVDAYGDIAATYDYAPFGAVSAGTPSGSSVPANPLQWSSEVYDSELGLVYYNFRHYSPSLGRFLSRDPISEQGGLNLYAFVKNTPNLDFDITGLRILGDLVPRSVSMIGVEDAGGLTKLVAPHFRMNYVTAKSKTYAKNGRCCFKYERYPEIDIEISSVYREKITGYTPNGIKAIKEHEARRISTYVNAHDFYLVWVVNFLSGKEICCDTYCCATDALSLFAKKVVDKTKLEFEAYVKRENAEIERENFNENRIINDKGEVDGLNYVYRVKKPSSLPVIDFVPSCEGSK